MDPMSAMMMVSFQRLAAGRVWLLTCFLCSPLPFDLLLDLDSCHWDRSYRVEWEEWAWEEWAWGDWEWAVWA